MNDVELPQFVNSIQASNVSSFNSSGSIETNWIGGTSSNSVLVGGYPGGMTTGIGHIADFINEPGQRRLNFDFGVTDKKKNCREENMSKDIALRLVRVFIVDPDENVPMESRLLHKDERLTDLTDQELFFDYNVKEILEKHNKFRVTLTDKEQTKAQGKEVRLEPIKIRDLQMITSDVFKVPTKK